MTKISGQALLLAIALPMFLLVGCGLSNPAKHSSADSGKQLQSAITTIPYKWPPELLSVPADVDGASSVSIKQTDFPPGWNENALVNTTAPADNVIDESFVQCLFGASPSPLSAYVVSPVMAGPSGSDIAQSFVRVVESSAAARSDFQSFKPDRVSACETAMYSKQFSYPAGTQIIGKKFGYAVPDSIPSDTILAPDGATDVLGIRFLVLPRDAPTLHQDVFAFGVGRFESVLLFQSSTGNPNEAAETQALKALKARAQAANA